MSICPYPCGNKTEFGYCRTTGCVNPRYAQQIFYSHNPQFIWSQVYQADMTGTETGTETGKEENARPVRDEEHTMEEFMMGQEGNPDDGSL